MFATEHAKTRVCADIIGHADLMLGAPVETVLQAMIRAGSYRFRGIRFVTASHPEQAAWRSAISLSESLLMSRKLREGFARLAPLGLSFDARMYKGFFTISGCTYRPVPPSTGAGSPATSRK